MSTIRLYLYDCVLTSARAKRKDFDERIKLFKIGDRVKLDCSGLYGRYRVEGKLKKVDMESGRVQLDKGFARSYRKIIAISS